MNAESIKQKLLNYSKKNQKIHQNTLTKYFQERLLYRLSVSAYKKNFLLKGGGLAYTISGEDSRHTRDIDFLAIKIEANQDNFKVIFKEICNIPVDDGVLFKASNIKVEAIQKEGNYNGTRIKIEAKLGKTTQQVQIDIGIGDYVTPSPQQIEYPTILKELQSPILQAYSIESLVSEKFNAMIDLGEFNSRLKDFYDLYKFLDKCDLKVLEEAIKNTFKRRKTKVTTNHPVFQEDFYENESRLKQWSIFLKKNQLESIDYKEVHKKIATHLHSIYEAL